MRLATRALDAAPAAVAKHFINLYDKCLNCLAVSISKQTQTYMHACMHTVTHILALVWLIYNANNNNKFACLIM